MKRYLSVLLAAVMIFAAIPLTFFTATAQTTPAAELVNLFAADRVVNAAAHSNTNKYPNGYDSNTGYYCTKSQIAVSAGDELYFFGDCSIGYHVTLYDLNGNGYGDTDKNVKPAALTVVDTLSGNYRIYKYTVPSNIGYVRLSQKAAAYNAGYVLLTKNQPFDKATYNEWCVRQGVNNDSLTGASGVVTNLFSFVSYGTPNTKTGGGDVAATSNYHFATGKNISVSEGDIIRVGPCLDEQTFQLMAYNSSKGVQINTESANVRTTRLYKQSNLFIMEYTVPSGISSVTPVCSQTVKELYIATKNQSLTESVCESYWAAKGFDAAKLIGGEKTTAAEELVNLFSDGAGGMGIHNGEGNYSKTDGFGTNEKYRSTVDKINLSQNDVLYFVGNKEIGHQLSLFKSDGTGVCNVNHNYLIQYANLGNGYYIYAYRIREDAAWARISELTSDYDAGLILATKNQPFDEAAYRAWCELNEIDADAAIGEEPDIDNLFVFKGYGTPNETTLDGEITSNKHFSTGNSIAVGEGDVITIAPIVENQTFQAVVFKTDGTSERIKATSVNVNVEPVSSYGTNLMIMRYKVPAGVTHIVPVGSQMHKDFYVVTKNQDFDAEELETYYINEGLEPETVICGAETTELKNIYNLFSTSAGIINGEAHWGKTASGVTTYYDHTTGYGTNKKYWCTDSIPMQEGDVVYFIGVGAGDIGYHVTVYGQNGKGINANVKPGSAYLPVYATLGNGYYIYAYHAPSNVGYIRISQQAAHYETGSILVTKNQPFSVETYEAWALANSAIVPDVDSKVYGKSALFIGDSITYGLGEERFNSDLPRLAWAGRLAKLYGMTVVNAGDSGARVSQTGSSGHIIDGLDKWTYSDDPDMVVMHGGVNDARYNGDVPIGTVNSTDVKTFCGGLNAMFKKARSKFPDADLFFIATFYIPEGKGAVSNMGQYFVLAKQICDKYGVTMIDLHGNDELNELLACRDSSGNPQWTTYFPDKLHPNAAGYNIITPYIAKALDIYYDPLATPELTNAAVSLGSDLTMKFYVTVDERADISEGELSLKVTMCGKTAELTEYEIVSGKYVFSFDGIAPQLMTELIDIELYSGGVKIDERLGYSVRENAQALLNEYPTDTKLTQVVSAMLRYGAAAQTYRKYKTDDLASSGVTGMSDAAGEAVPSTDKEITTESAAANVYFTGVGVRFDSVNKLYVKLSSCENAKLIVKRGNTTVATHESVESDTVYSGGIFANDFNTVYTFELYEGDTLVQTLKYSVRSYCYSMQGNDNADIGALALALYEYGCAASEYNK